MIDIGSGGGSPAIPMALAFGSVELLMVEAKLRKAVFLQEAIRQLDMQDARVASARYETLLSDPSLREHFDLLTIRAVRVSASVLSELPAFVKPGGSVVLFRSDTSQECTPGRSLRLIGSHMLVESLRSHIDVFERQA
jgi:16S rRNA (guanine527-N7)-methyltransferase